MHGGAGADISPLAAADRALAWVRAENAVLEVRRRLAQGPEMISASLLEVLFQAVADEP